MGTKPQKTDILRRGEETQRDRYTVKIPCVQRGRDWSDRAASQERPGHRQPPEAEAKKECSQPVEAADPVDSLISLESNFIFSGPTWNDSG